jgi:hypothetical protein
MKIRARIAVYSALALSIAPIALVCYQDRVIAAQRILIRLLWGGH